MTATTDNSGRSAHEPSRNAPAKVVAVLPNERFRVRLDDGSEKVAHVAGELRKGFTRLLPGDVVRIETSPLDPQQARIVARLPQQRT